MPSLSSVSAKRAMEGNDGLMCECVGFLEKLSVEKASMHIHGFKWLSTGVGRMCVKVFVGLSREPRSSVAKVQF